jgi:dTMP kinase
MNILYSVTIEVSGFKVSNGVRKGCFIVFEGIDGSGKSEQFRRLTEKKKKEHYRIVATREPTKNTEIGKFINRVLYENAKISEETLALLFAADRVEHTNNVILPALKQNSIVVSDRYVYSSIAYQTKGMDKELNKDWVSTINKFAIKPDVVIYLDITAETGQNRLKNGQIRFGDHTYFENIIKQEKIRSVYYSIFNFDKKTLFDFEEAPKKIERTYNISHIESTKILRVDGDLPIEEIEKIINNLIVEILEIKNISPLTKGNKIRSLSSFNSENK